MTLRIGINTRLAKFLPPRSWNALRKCVCLRVPVWGHLFAWRYSAYTVATSCPNMALKADFTIRHCSFNMLRDRYCSKGPNCNITHTSSHKHWVSRAAVIRYVWSHFQRSAQNFEILCLKKGMMTFRLFVLQLPVQLFSQSQRSTRVHIPRAPSIRKTPWSICERWCFAFFFFYDSWPNRVEVKRRFWDYRNCFCFPDSGATVRPVESISKSLWFLHAPLVPVCTNVLPEFKNRQITLIGGSIPWSLSWNGPGDVFRV